VQALQHRLQRRRESRQQLDRPFEPGQVIGEVAGDDDAQQRLFFRVAELQEQGEVRGTAG
jgi:hypothetical protein